MISALADAGAAFGRADYLAAAVACASFVESELRSEDGGLLRVFNRGRAKQPGFLDDYAYLLEAYLTLYESTFDERWFIRAVELAEAILDPLPRPRARRLLLHRRRAHGPHRAQKRPRGRPDPLRRLIRLLRPFAPVGRLTGRGRPHLDAASSPIALLHPIAPRHPLAFGHLLRAMDFFVSPVREVALAGPADELAAVVRQGYFPHLVLAGGGGSAVPLLAGRDAVDGAGAAYVCEHFTCQLPLTSAEDLAKSLQ